MKIKHITITPVSPNNGLVAFASVIMDDDILLNSIAIYEKLGGGYRLLYPSKRIKGRDVTVFHPLNQQTSRYFEDAIFKKVGILKKRCGNDRYNSISF